MPVEILARISCIHIRSLSNSSLGICVKTAVAIPWSFSSRAYPLQVLLSQRPRFGTGDWLIHEWCSPHWLLCWILRHSETFVIPSFLFPILRKKILASSCLLSILTQHLIAMACFQHIPTSERQLQVSQPCTVSSELHHSSISDVMQLLWNPVCLSLLLEISSN